MLDRCINQDKDTVLKYIGDNFPRCLYLYLDILKYGCLSDKTSTWIQIEDGEISSVILAYHSALHIFSRENDFVVTEICELIKEIGPTIIIAAAETIRRLEPALSKEGFHSEFGHVGEWFGNVCESTGNVVAASDEDIPEVAKMLYEDDDIGASYRYDDLLSQMRERLAEGYVRSYVIRKKDKPIAHVGTGAEIDGVCTIAYTIVSKQYRGKGLARQLYNQACGRLKKEGMRIFSVYYPENARLFHHKVGFADVCECGKLYLNVD